MRIAAKNSEGQMLGLLFSPCACHMQHHQHHQHKHDILGTKLLPHQQIMKLVFLLSLGMTSLAFAPFHHETNRQTALLNTKPAMGWTDAWFRPIHGHGSGENQLGEIYEAEQEVLKERKRHFGKSILKKKYQNRATTSNSLQNTLEDFFSHPFHGHGSSHRQSDLNAMFRAQQQVLYERREYSGNKDMLHRKYHRAGENHLKDIALHKHDPALLNKKEDDAMYSKYFCIVSDLGDAFVHDKRFFRCMPSPAYLPLLSSISRSIFSVDKPKVPREVGLYFWY